MGTRIIMIYDLKGRDTERIKLNRKLFPYKIQSHKGKYKRTTQGILKKYEKPVRSVIIFEKRNLNEVRKVVDYLKINYKLYEIHKQLK